MKTYNYSKKYNIEDFNNDHDVVLNNITNDIKIEPDEIMAFSIENNVIFIRKEDLEKLWTKFAEVVIPEPNMEINDFHDEYAEIFFRYIARKMFANEWQKMQYFCQFVETTYDIYRGK